MHHMGDSATKIREFFLLRYAREYDATVPNGPKPRLDLFMQGDIIHLDKATSDPGVF